MCLVSASVVWALRCAGAAGGRRALPHLLVGQQTAYAASAGGQSVQTLTLPRARGDFYDRTGRRLTGLSQRYYALCLPGDAGYTALFPYVPYAEQSLLYERRNLASPFLIQVDRDLTAQGITTCTVPQHFGGSTAAHLLGYLDSEGRGVSGLEKAYDDLLTASGDARTVTCFMTAQGRLLTDTSPLVAVETPGTGQGVRLTLDADLQRACEGLATLYLPRGCIVVMDTATGEVLASVSMPSFDPQNIAASIAANDTSLLNRPLRAFSAGSVFKVVLAAAAYESGLDWYTHDCTGEVEVAGQTYRCALVAPTAWSTCAAHWNKAATPISSSWAACWGHSASAKWQRHSASARPRSLRPACKAHLAHCRMPPRLKTQASWRRSALVRGR